METPFRTWMRGDTPKDRQFLAAARDARSQDSEPKHVRVVAEWHGHSQSWRQITFSGSPDTGVELDIECWQDIPNLPT